MSSTEAWAVLGVALAAAGVVATLVARRPAKSERLLTSATARAQARRLEFALDWVAESAKGAPGFHDTLKLSLTNTSTEPFLWVVVEVDRGDGSTAWWQSADGVPPEGRVELRLPSEWPCPVDVYFVDHLERRWRRRFRQSDFGEVEGPLRASDCPSFSDVRHRRWRRGRSA
jgi:hypothetical protein